MWLQILFCGKHDPSQYIRQLMWDVVKLRGEPFKNKFTWSFVTPIFTIEFIIAYKIRINANSIITNRTIYTFIFLKKYSNTLTISFFVGIFAVFNPATSFSCLIACMVFIGNIFARLFLVLLRKNIYINNNLFHHFRQSNLLYYHKF